jgi:hypothetical protein
MQTTARPPFPAATMTTFEQIDTALRAKGWHYDRGNELFTDGERPIDWGQVVNLVSEIALDELDSFQEDESGHI